MEHEADRIHQNGRPDRDAKVGISKDARSDSGPVSEDVVNREMFRLTWVITHE